jgi:hypothetical protein
MNSDLQRFRELLPFFVNGTLNEIEQIFVNEYLQQHPEAQTEVDFSRALRSSVKAVGSERHKNAGLERLMKSIHQKRHMDRMGLLERWRHQCRKWGFTPALATLSIIVVVQSMVMIQLWHLNQKPSSLSTYRSLPTPILQAHIKLTISPSANFGDLVILMRQTGCRIVNGPSENGELWLVLEDSDRLSEVRDILQSAPGVSDLLIIGTIEK